MKKGIEWLKKRELIANIKSLAREASQEWSHEEMVELRDVLREIDLFVPKQEVPVVPKHVADWMDDNIKRYGTVYSFIISLVEAFSSTVPEKVQTYARENPDAMARAYLGGYTVAEEPSYTARLKVITGQCIESYLRTQSQILKTG